VGKSSETDTTWSERIELGGKIKGPTGSIKAEAHFECSKESTTGEADHAELSLGLDKPKEGASGKLAESLRVQTYWMKAKDSKAYWVPTLFRTGGNDEAPWCIDYRVEEWRPYRGQTMQDSPTCAVAVVASPSDGGTVGISSANSDSNIADVPVGGAAVVTAAPNDGYRFVHWEAGGGQLNLADRTELSTSASVSNGGGASAVAVFERVLPGKLVVKPGRDGTCSVRMTGAGLPGMMASGSGAADPSSVELGVSLGDEDVAIPADGWLTETGMHHNVSQPWGLGSRLDVTLDPAAGTWSLAAEGVQDAESFLLDCADGQVTIGLTHDDDVLGVEEQQVAVNSVLKPAPALGRATYSRVEARHAVVRVAAPADPRGTRFAIRGVRVQRKLLSPRGFLVDVNGQQFRTGPFRRRADGAWVWRGKTLYQYQASCVYTPKGTMNLQLSGRYLRPQLETLVAGNVSVRVARGARWGSGNLMAEVRSLKGMAPIE
jgi:hypothetical protein